MRFPKNERIKDEKTLEAFRNRPCDVCRNPPPSDPAHIQTVKSGGPDTPDNLFSLCRKHHVEQHKIGIQSFCDKYKLGLSYESGWPRRNN
jgi:hypothetical protein